MLTLVTGLPGSGKTQMIIDKLIKKKLPVYYANIKWLFVPVGWHEFKPDEWQSLPAGSVMLIDEAQDFFPVGSLAVPDWVLQLSKHRHKGIDGYLITQAPTFIHSFVRKLCGEWLDVVRMFGRNASSVHRRSKVDDTQPITSSLIYKYDRDIWKLYESATVHTSHGRIPLKAFAVIAVAGLIITATVLFGLRASKNLTEHGLTPNIKAAQAGEKKAGSSPGVISSASADEGKKGCAVLMGIVSNSKRALLSFENVDGTTYQVGILPKQLQADRLEVDGCFYYVGAGSLNTLDPVARAAVAARKQSESNPPVVGPPTTDKATVSSVPLRSSDPSSVRSLNLPLQTLN
jgi:zona occludens toxin